MTANFAKSALLALVLGALSAPSVAEYKVQIPLANLGTGGDSGSGGGSALPDADNDTIPDVADADADGDGSIDSSASDTDGDGVKDAADADQTGNADINGDGIDDGVVVPDGIDQSAATDTDGDTIPDIADVDPNGDGSVANGIDSNGNGINDTSDIAQTDGSDADGNHIDDAIVPPSVFEVKRSRVHNVYHKCYWGGDEAWVADKEQKSADSFDSRCRMDDRYCVKRWPDGKQCNWVDGGWEPYNIRFWVYQVYPAS